MSDIDTDALAGDLFEALGKRRAPVPLLSARFPAMTIDDAYAVSLGVLRRRVAAGERVVGKKIGLTAAAVQQALGIDEPDFGFLTDAMAVPDGGEISTARHFFAPMIEAEIAFILKARLAGPGVTAQDVLAATQSVAACLEIVDTRFDNPRIAIVDTIADNASSAGFVLGQARLDPSALDLAAVRCTLARGGEQILEGSGAAVMGNPLHAVAWLANRLGAYGTALEPGDVILPGSMIPFAPARAGDRFTADMGVLGTVSVAFA